MKGLEPFNGNFGINEARHLLNRTMFGAKFNQITEFSKIPLNECLNRLFYNTTPLVPPVINYEDPSFNKADYPNGKTWVNLPFDNRYSVYQTYSLQQWWIGRQLDSTGFNEKMILFWQNHFGINVANLNKSRYGYNLYLALANNCFSNFKNLVKIITVEPAMLDFLNGQYNETNAPDENYARELMELFTLGKGSESKYTEEDVRAAARALTGFQIEPNFFVGFMQVGRHDQKDKKFSEFFDNHIIKGRYEENLGNKIANELIEMIFKKDEVSKYICRKFYQFFVNTTITAETESIIIEPLAKFFRDNNFEIQPTLQLLIGSNHFFEKENIGTMIKSPVDFLIGNMKQIEVKFPPKNQVEALYTTLGNFRYLLEVLQQDPTGPPSVAGWPAYYQVPIYGRYWINSDTIQIRSVLMDVLVDATYKPGGVIIGYNLTEYLKNFLNASDPNKLIDDLCQTLYSVEVTAEYKKKLKAILLSNQDQDYYWTEAWNNYIANQTSIEFKNILESRLKPMFKDMLNQPEYHLH